MLYRLTDSASKANAPDYYCIEVMIVCVKNSGMLMSMWEVVAWQLLDVGGWITVSENESYNDTRPASRCRGQLSNVYFNPLSRPKKECQ